MSDCPRKTKSGELVWMLVCIARALHLVYLSISGGLYPNMRKV